MSRAIESSISPHRNGADVDVEQKQRFFVAVTQWEKKSAKKPVK